jgi:hypothetical protein
MGCTVSSQSSTVPSNQAPTVVPPSQQQQQANQSRSPNSSIPRQPVPMLASLPLVPAKSYRHGGAITQVEYPFSLVSAFSMLLSSWFVG